MIVKLFSEYRTQIVFLHVISAVIWVGGMIAMRFAAHHSFQELEDAPTKITRTAHALKRLFTIVSPFVIILLVTAVFMAVGLSFRDAALDDTGHVVDDYAMFIYNMIHVKEAIWTIMAINLFAMILRRNKAQKLIDTGEFKQAGALLKVIGQYMVPLNIVLGIIAIYFGVFLRNAY